MYLRRYYRKKDGKRHDSWALVESYRTARGPRQRVVAYLGEMDAHGRMALAPADGSRAHQQPLYGAGEAPQWAEVDLTRCAWSGRVTSAAHGWGTRCCTA
jgi:hypothetical protein